MLSPQDSPRLPATDRESRFVLRLLRQIVFIHCVIALSACGSLYPHDDEAQKAAQAASDAWKKAAIDKVFDDQRDYLGKLAASEVEAAKLEIAAQRDLQLVHLLDGLDVRPALQKRLGKIVGDKYDLADIASAKDKITNARVDIDFAKATLTTVASGFRNDGYRGPLPTCDTPRMVVSPDIPTEQQENLNSRLASLQETCLALADREENLNKEISKVAKGGELNSIITELITSQTGLAAQQQRAAALKNIVDKKKKDIKAADDQAAKALQFCLADPTATSHQAAADEKNADSLTAANKVACAVKIDLKDTVKAVDPLIRRIKHAALLDEIQAALTTVLSQRADAAAKDASADPELSATTKAALSTLDLFAEMKKPDTNSLLLALAYEQYQYDIASADLETIKTRISIYEDRREARLAEASFIARALQELGQKNHNAGRIRAYVNASWNSGAYRAALAEYAEDDLIRSDKMRRASVITGSWRNILQPAIDQLVAYGNGGLDKQTIANLIIALVNAGGFAAVAVNVN